MEINLLAGAAPMTLVCHQPMADLSRLPALVITEISAVPGRKSTRRGGYVAVYNTTDSPIDLGEYTLAEVGKEGTAEIALSKSVSGTLEGGILPVGGICLLMFNDSRDATVSVADVKEVLSKRTYRPDKYYPEDVLADDVLFAVYNNNRVFYPDVPYIETGVAQTFEIRKGGELVCRASTTDFDGMKISSVYYTADFEGDVRVMKRVAGGCEVMNGKTGAFPYFEKRQAPVVSDLSLTPVEFGLEFRCRITNADSYNRSYIVVKTKYTENHPVVPNPGYTPKSHGAYHYYRLRRVEGSEDTYVTLIPESILYATPYIEYSLSVMNGFAYYDSEACRISYNEATPPVLLAQKPSDKYVCKVDAVLPLLYRFDSAIGILPESFAVTLDGTPVTDIEVKKNGEEYTFAGTLPALAAGEHIIKAEIADKNGNVTAVTSEIRADNAPVMTHFMGDLHGHTEDSDGTGRAYDAYRLSREAADSDFVAITDHNMDFMWYSPYLADTHKYFSFKSARPSFGKGGMMPIFGFEYTWEMVHGFYGHMNVFNPDFVDMDLSKGVPGLYKSEFATSGKCVAQFNHPYNCWGTFAEFGYHDSVSHELVRLYEMNGSSLFIPFNYALMKGWHISPAHNNDDHRGKWVTANAARTVIISPSLNADNLLESMHANRTYRTSSPDIHLDFSINGEMMGSKLQNPEVLRVKIDARNRSGVALGTVELYGENCTLLKTFEAADTFAWEGEIPTRDKYLFVRIINKNIRDAYTVSAPIWTGVEKGVEIADAAVQGDALSFTLKANRTTDAVVEVYQTDDLILDCSENGPAPSATKKISVAAGVQQVKLPLTPEKQRIYVFLKTDKETACEIVNYSDVIITEAMPLTSPYTDADGKVTQNPFSYLKVKNVSTHKASLSGLTLRRIRVEGQSPRVAGLFTVMPDVVLDAGEEMYFWMKTDAKEAPADNTLTEADMRRHLGTDKRILEICQFPLDVMCSIISFDRGEWYLPITGVKFNIYQNYGKDIVADKALHFVFQHSSEIFAFPDTHPVY